MKLSHLGLRLNEQEAQGSLGGSSIFRPFGDQGITRTPHSWDGHLTKWGQDLTEVAESSLGTKKQGSAAWLPESCNGMNLRCRFLFERQCQRHLTFWNVPLVTSVELCVSCFLTISFTSLLSAPPPSALWLAAVPSVAQDPCHSPRCKPRRLAWADRA